jgi:hypothetical protein
MNNNKNIWYIFLFKLTSKPSWAKIRQFFTWEAVVRKP